MPDPVLTPPGFWGKLPAAGDFVGRRLPGDFMRHWDRWITRHLMPRVEALDVLCFHVRPLAVPAMTGVVVASADRAGRRFPLTLAAALEGPADDAWYGALAAAGRAASEGLDVAALDARLVALLPPASEVGRSSRGLLLWTPGTAAAPVDADAPGAVLDALLGTSVEVR